MSPLGTPLHRLSRLNSPLMQKGQIDTNLAAALVHIFEHHLITDV